MTFIEKVAVLNAENYIRTGRISTYSVQTFGCQMNERDSETISGMLLEMGYHESESEDDADVVVFNTCCVRENAETKLFGRLGSMKNLKIARPGMIIAVCGCMMQEADKVREIRKKFKQADIVFGTFNLADFPEMIHKKLTSGERIVQILEDGTATNECLPVDRKDKIKAGVAVMFGCDNFCSYCIVPYVRGRERSRLPADIANEVRSLAATGYKEILLLGQNVNSYGKDLAGAGIDFSDLLRLLSGIEGIERIRFMTSHPKDLSVKLIEAIAEDPKICHQIHLPVQSGSTDILERMNRKYTKESYLALIGRIRAAIPDVCISTDIIVGFPGETEADFEETLDLIRQVRFDSAYTFIYSRREGTPAAKDLRVIPEEVISNRFDRLLETQNRISREINESLVGSVQKVLAEGPSKKDKNMWTGRSDGGKIVNFTSEADCSGRILNIRIVNAQTWSLDGVIA